MLLLPSFHQIVFFKRFYTITEVIKSFFRQRPWFLLTFNMIISHIFPKNFIEIPQVVQKIWKLFLSVLNSAWLNSKYCLSSNIWESSKDIITLQKSLFFHTFLCDSSFFSVAKEWKQFRQKKLSWSYFS